MKRRLLYITELFPHPADSGGRIKTLNTITTLSKRFEVKVVCFSSSLPHLHSIRHLSRYVKDISIFVKPELDASENQSFTKLFKYYLRFVPFYVTRYIFPEIKPQILKIIEDFSPEFIHLDHINMAYYLPDIKKQTWIYEEQNIEHQLLFSEFLHTKSIKKKLYYLLESILTFFWEKKHISRFDFIFAISQLDQLKLSSLFRIRSATYPVVYPLMNITKRSQEDPHILFIGSLCWPPNADAVLWFTTEILSKIIKRFPNATFHIVGERNIYFEKKIPQSLPIVFHGHLKNLKPQLERATAFVLPFRMGGGVRIKALTAMAAGIPIVSTTLGIQGLSVVHEKECLIADTAHEFSHHLSQIISHPQIRSRIAVSERLYLAKYHGKQLNQKFLKFYLSFIQ